MRPIEAKVLVERFNKKKTVYEEALSIVAGVEIKLVEVEAEVKVPLQDVDEPVDETEPETE